MEKMHTKIGIDRQVKKNQNYLTSELTHSSESVGEKEHNTKKNF